VAFSSPRRRRDESSKLAALPGNTFLPAAATGLPRDSVVDVTALVTLNKSDLRERVPAPSPCRWSRTSIADCAAF
jgi:hypothetical protein